MLEIKGLTKRFGKKIVLDNISFNFGREVYGLLAPNGAGKTTLMRCITRLYNIQSEKIFFNNVCIVKNKDYLSHLGYLPQGFGLFKDLTVFEMMLLLANLKDVDSAIAKPMVLSCVERVNLSDRLDSKVGKLSGGMIRRLGIAQALLNDPDIIIFDEPTAGLDPEERLRFKSIVADIKKDKLIIISTHIVEDVEALCDKVAIMSNNKINVCGSCKEIQDIAQNKVYIIPEERLKSIKGNYVLQKKFERDGNKMLRILTNELQEINPATPNVEDGYICTLKNI